MKRPILPLLLLLCLFLAISFAQELVEDDNNENDDPNVPDDARLTVKQVRTLEKDGVEQPVFQLGLEDAEGNVIEEAGQEEETKKAGIPDDVRTIQAREMLHAIKLPTLSKLEQLTRKPNGIWGTIAYYAKEAFMLLFMNSPQQDSMFGASSAKLSKPLSDAVKLLENAANDNDPSAIYLLAEMNFHGKHTHPINYDEAFRRYQQLSNLNGNSTAQYMIGFIYATGLAPSVPSNQAKSMLYHTFAAEAGNTRSQMTLAYRNIAGIAMPRDCDEGVHWYKQVARKAYNYYRSGPPGGHSLIREAYRIADEDGGVYGEGASVASAGQNAKQGGPTSDAYADVDDVLEYLHLQSEKGDLRSTFGLARIYYDGRQGRLKKDYKLAKTYFLQVAREYWPNSSNKVRKDVPPGTEKLAAKAAGYLGRMFLRGEGMTQSFPIAQKWFMRGVSNGDALCQYSLGLMYLDGLGVTKDAVKAGEYFGAAADQNLAVAQSQLGVLMLDQGDINTASQYFQHATRSGSIEAYYYLAEMFEQGIGRDRNCGVAASYYKIVAEKAEPVWSDLAEANAAYDAGDLQKAVVAYLMAAEQGSEPAQANVAWLLDASVPRWSLFSRAAKTGKMFGDTALAIIHWTRSAKQQNFDSLVKMGDYYLSSTEGSGSNPENAAACYQAAAESLQSAQAMWNLGWMHENGVGISQDFHLAKRFYDQALETNPKEAYMTVQLSLFKLRWRSWWNGITRGGVNGIGGEEGEPRKRRSLSEWLVDFLEADAANEYYAAEEEDYEHADDYEAGWEDVDDGVLDAILIGGLVAGLAGLVWYRQRQQAAVEARRREREAQEGRGEEGERDRGVFPGEGDPAIADWMAGAIGR